MVDTHDTEALTAIITLLFALIVGLVLLYRHPPHDIVPHVGRASNITVAAVRPPGGRPPQPNPHPADVHQPNHFVHIGYSVVALDPPLPPSYHEYPGDTRIDGPVPSYSSTGNSNGSTVNVVPAPSPTAPLAENADQDEDEEGSNV